MKGKNVLCRHSSLNLMDLDALLEGGYEGEMTYGQLRCHGDFGIGTFNGLDGEMIGFDGRFCHIPVLPVICRNGV